MDKWSILRETLENQYIPLITMSKYKDKCLQCGYFVTSREYPNLHCGLWSARCINSDEPPSSALYT
ncbi:hypothetical protein LCGC14_0316660 [marine sediment metagenome]|uniref:Uncharacterized protein n=1 Tax=marine sediment metagenome TaxID=412755 RepID=A0A0F9TQW9_9ZZZZ